MVHVFQIQISHLTALDPPYPPSLKSTTTSSDGLRALNRAKDNSVFHRQNPCLYNSRCLPCLNITIKHKANRGQLLLQMFSILCSPLLQFIILPNNRLFPLSLLSSILFFRVFVQFYKIILYFNPGHQHSCHPILNKSIFIIFLPVKLLLNRRNNNGYYNSNGQAEFQPASQFDSEFTYSYFPTVAFQLQKLSLSAQIKASSSNLSHNHWQLLVFFPLYSRSKTWTMAPTIGMIQDG